MPMKHLVLTLRDEVFHQLPAMVIKKSFRDLLVGSVTNEQTNTEKVNKATKAMPFEYFSNLLGGKKQQWCDLC
jgi:hypothetical protein